MEALSQGSLLKNHPLQGQRITYCQAPNSSTQSKQDLLGYKYGLVSQNLLTNSAENTINGSETSSEYEKVRAFMAGQTHLYDPYNQDFQYTADMVTNFYDFWPLSPYRALEVRAFELIN